MICKQKNIYCEYWIDDEQGCVLDYYVLEYEKEEGKEGNDETLPLMSSE